MELAITAVESVLDFRMFDCSFTIITHLSFWIGDEDFPCQAVMITNSSVDLLVFI